MNNSNSVSGVETCNGAITPWYTGVMVSTLNPCFLLFARLLLSYYRGSNNYQYHVEVPHTIIIQGTIIWVIIPLNPKPQHIGNNSGPYVTLRQQGALLAPGPAMGQRSASVDQSRVSSCKFMGNVEIGK